MMVKKQENTFRQLKLLFSVFCLLGALLVANGVIAAPITFIDVYSGSVLLNASNPSYGFTHNIDNFDPLTDTLSSANLWLTFVDDSLFDGPERVQLDFGGGQASFEFNLAGIADIDISVAQLNDGILEVLLTREWGDFYFKGSLLAAQGDRGNGTDPSAPVPAPEPSTLLLLGSGLTGLGLWGGRRRMGRRTHSRLS